MIRIAKEIAAVLLAFSPIAIVFAIIFFAMPAWPRDNGQWEATDADIRWWYRNLKQPDNPGQSCCGEADAYWADSFEVSPNGEYVAIITDERTVPGRPPIAVGTKIVIPKHKLKYDDGNPTGHGIVFVTWAGEEESWDGWRVYCYITPGGV